MRTKEVAKERTKEAEAGKDRLKGKKERTKAMKRETKRKARPAPRPQMPGATAMVIARHPIPPRHPALPPPPSSPLPAPCAPTQTPPSLHLPQVAKYHRSDVPTNQPPLCPPEISLRASGGRHHPATPFSVFSSTKHIVVYLLLCQRPATQPSSHAQTTL